MVDTVPGFESFWQFGTNTTVLVGGRYLVRNATISGGTLALRGNLNASVPLTVVILSMLLSADRVPGRSWPHDLPAQLNMEPKLGGVAHCGISVYLTASVASSLVSSSSAVLGKGSSLSHIKQFNLQATSARRRPLCIIVQADGLPDTVVLGTHGVRVPRCSCQSRSIPYAARDIGT
ncbi:hypothetical protein LXA43DRAFT_1105617 [Ganoderma leucocontextum]|nr:hypothetical protein LXA43DRAFT_1105617 [Ganoderma leucocontextum]